MPRLTHGCITMISEFICVLCSVVSVIYVYFRCNRAGRLMAKIPGPKGRPFIGNMLTLYKEPVQLFKDLREWSSTYSKIYKLAGFHYRTVHIRSPDDVETLLSSVRHSHKDMPYTFFQGWLGDGLLTSNGEKWQQRRKLLTPAFHFNILTKFLKIFNVQTMSLLESLENEVGKEETDIVPLINKFTLRTMCETSLGTKISENTSFVKKYMENVHNLGDCYVTRLTRPWYFLNFLYKISPLYLKEKSFLPDTHNFTKHIIQKRREFINKNNRNEESCKKIMIDILLDEEKKDNLSENGIREEVDTFLFEGHDTTATALIFMIVRIANETLIQKSIHAELEDIFGDDDREPTIADVNMMKYLECCIKESLRLYPSVPFISRYITKEITIAGHRVPKNTYYDVHIYDVHRNPDVYPDPEKFIPERFLQENAVRRHPYAYIPFSAGPRNCIGQKFALIEMKTFMSSLLRKYRLEPVTRTKDLQFVADIILRVTHPMCVRFSRRSN